MRQKRGLKLTISQCPLCRMDLLPGEYHPYAACLIYQNAGSERQARAALREVMQWARSHSYRRDEKTGAVVERLR